MINLSRTIGFPFIILCLFLFINQVEACSALGVVINEIAWMGTEISYNDEWIELYNNTGQDVNLEGWTIIAQDGTPTINLSGTIPNYSFFLLERTDDTTVFNVTADQTYTGSLGNTGEYLKLFDSQDNLIDEINCDEGWFAGDNSSKQTMERKSFLAAATDNWQTSENPGGTPKAKNTAGYIFSPEEPQSNIVPEKIGTETYPSGIIFNEIMPSPKGSDAENEWIEIFNQNNFEVDLFGWKIKDSMGTTKTYIFSEGIKINPIDFLVVYRPETKIILNNDNDSLTLLNPDDVIIDIVSYEKAIREESYNRTDDGWAWNINPTPGAMNIITNYSIAFSTSTNVENEKESLESIDKPLQDKRELIAAAGVIAGDRVNPLNIYLIALSVAILSGIAILFLKNKLKLIFLKK